MWNMSLGKTQQFLINWNKKDREINKWFQILTMQKLCFCDPKWQKSFRKNILVKALMSFNFAGDIFFSFSSENLEYFDKLTLFILTTCLEKIISFWLYQWVKATVWKESRIKFQRNSMHSVLDLFTLKSVVICKH